MNRFGKIGILLAIVLVLAFSVSGIRERGILVVRKLAGSSTESWSEVAVQLIPYRWQEKARRFLGHWADEWSQPLSFQRGLGNQKRRSYPIYLGATPNLGSLDCHYTILAEGQTPHPPHVH